MRLLLEYVHLDELGTIDRLLTTLNDERIVLVRVVGDQLDVLGEYAELLRVMHIAADVGVDVLSLLAPDSLIACGTDDILGVFQGNAIDMSNHQTILPD